MDSVVRNVIDRVIAVSIVECLNSDAGWRRGEVSEVRAGGGNSNGQMVHQVELMFKVPNDPYTQWCSRVMDNLIAEQGQRCADCLITSVFYANRVDSNGCSFSQSQLAKTAGVSVAAYKNNLKKGCQFIQRRLDERSMALAS